MSEAVEATWGTAVGADLGSSCWPDGAVPEAGDAESGGVATGGADACAAGEAAGEAKDDWGVAESDDDVGAAGSGEVRAAVASVIEFFFTVVVATRLGAPPRETASIASESGFRFWKLQA